MAQLSELQAELDAGKIVWKTKGADYSAVQKRNGIYVSVEGGSRFTHKRFATFEDLCTEQAPDEEAFSSEECSWEVWQGTPEETEELAFGFMESLEKGDLNTASRYLSRPFGALTEQPASPESVRQSALRMAKQVYERLKKEEP